MYPRLASAIERLAERLREWPTSASVFLPNGRPPRVGEIFVQRELGGLFRRLVAIERAHTERGRSAAIMAARDAIYEGDIANEIASFMREAGGAITAADLREQRVRIEAPVHSTYRGIDVYACGPWSQGPLVPMALNLLEGYDVASFGPGRFALAAAYTSRQRKLDAIPTELADQS